jgi:hypothetical protein
MPVRVIEIRPEVCHRLYVQSMLPGLILGERSCHPDGTRQRKARQLARDRRAARELKAQYVPLCFVDRTVYLEDWERWYDEGSAYRRWRSITGRWDGRERQVVYCPTPTGRVEAS